MSSQSKDNTCPTCEGRGWIFKSGGEDDKKYGLLRFDTHHETCPACHGSGQQEDKPTTGTICTNNPNHIYGRNFKACPFCFPTDSKPEKPQLEWPCAKCKSKAHTTAQHIEANNYEASQPSKPDQLREILATWCKTDFEDELVAAIQALLATEYDRGKVEGAVEELVAIRDTYDRMEDKGFKLEGDSWRNWKGVRNVISDRLEELTGSRTPELKGENRESGE